MKLRAVRETGAWHDPSDKSSVEVQLFMNMTNESRLTAQDGLQGI